MGQRFRSFPDKGFVERIGAKPSIVLDQYCHSGITVFNTMSVGTEAVEEYYWVMNRKEIALNVNTKEELELAKNYWSSASRTLPRI